MGPQVNNPDITAPLITKQVNISMEAKPKFMNIGYYWDDMMMDKVTELIRESQHFFPKKFIELKGIIGDLGVMKIMLKLDTKPVKKIPYRLNLKYKEKVHLELDKTLVAGIIELVEKSHWVSLMVVHEKRQKDEIMICVGLSKLNDACICWVL